jgi:hypothetical protein
MFRVSLVGLVVEWGSTTLYEAVRSAFPSHEVRMGEQCEIIKERIAWE